MASVLRNFSNRNLPSSKRSQRLRSSSSAGSADNSLGRGEDSAISGALAAAMNAYENESGATNYGATDVERGRFQNKVLLTKQDLENIRQELNLRSSRSIYVGAIAIFLMQLFILLFYGIFVYSPENEYYSATTDLTSMYLKFNSLIIMIILGFGLIHVKSKKSSLTTVVFTFVFYIITFEFSFLTNLFWKAIYANSFSYTGGAVFTAYELYHCAYAGMAVVITYGILNDSVTFFQMLVIAVVETITFSFLLEYVAPSLDLFDPGYTYLIHIFAAYFGIGVSLINGVPFEKWKVTSELNPDISLFGTLFLYIYWPSFVGGTYTANSHEAQHSFINTILAMNASAISSFVFSPIFSRSGKFRVEDIRTSTIAGGIITGAVCIIPMSPFFVISIGTLAGFISILSNRFLEEYLFNELGIYDSNGNHSTHGVVGILGAFVSVFIIDYHSKYETDDDTFTNTNYASWKNGIMIPIVVFTSLFAGILGGIISQQANYFELILADNKLSSNESSGQMDFERYFDHNDFEVLSNDVTYFEVPANHELPVPSGYTKHSRTLDYIASHLGGTSAKLDSQAEQANETAENTRLLNLFQSQEVGMVDDLNNSLANWP